MQGVECLVVYTATQSRQPSSSWDNDVVTDYIHILVSFSLGSCLVLFKKAHVRRKTVDRRGGGMSVATYKMGRSKVITSTASS